MIHYFQHLNTLKSDYYRKYADGAGIDVGPYFDHRSWSTALNRTGKTSSMCTSARFVVMMVMNI